ncbi:hypothetical protein JQC92_03825 [Shewanella sp. 202IG2-18]|uniref:cytochrome-c peroxidase n=1 Tax=Parashewanella hymeniacidonis TaxID=2807618 RepID=UPI0019622660|nr:cytochrome c peroxidase [Parashewanella hymeniacidonis]MBM7071170.1 hypothetical protein [Parashewanella hymeniacidonis]
MLVRTRFLITSIMISGLIVGCGSDSKSKKVEPEIIEPAKELTAKEIREFIAQQVGSLEHLKIPATNTAIPLPPVDDDKDYYIKTTEEKRYLGKQLFHDSVRTVRIRPEFGGMPELAQTGSCGSCHFGEVGSKAGTQINFNLGGEGKGYTDAEGKFHPRRRARMDILDALRSDPLFEGDLKVDRVPTLTDVYENAVGLPSIPQFVDEPGALIHSGRFDAVDSVGRNAPSVVGSAFNNRLLGGGFAGEPMNNPIAINPFGDPAQENITLLLLDAHRMLEDQSAVLQQIPGYVELFRRAFPQEARAAEELDDLNLLINDQTVLRATATFIRTVITRNTPWDHFLAGDDEALTPAQLRGAKLFFTKAKDDGAGCVSCHSGPALNKQINDPDIAGVGEFVEENFFNLGLSDHPLQALNRHVRNDPNYRDEGRMEVTGREEDAHKFRTTTLRQLKGSRVFFHNGEFKSIKGVVEYFNAGQPQDSITGNSPTLSTRFTHPRGEGSERGLGLSETEINDLVAYLEDGLYDDAFVNFDPNSTTDTFQLNERDVTYSVHRPFLTNAGVADGFVISGMAQNNNDPLTRRDAGMEFLDVTDKVETSLYQRIKTDGEQRDEIKIKNSSDYFIDTHLLIIIDGLPDGVTLVNASGMTEDTEKPYLRVFLDDEGVLKAGASKKVTFTLADKRDADAQSTIDDYVLTLKSGQGNP